MTTMRRNIENAIGGMIILAGAVVASHTQPAHGLFVAASIFVGSIILTVAFWLASDFIPLWHRRRVG